jgi:hypothetical protein
MAGGGGHNPPSRRAVCEQHKYGSVGGARGNPGAYPIAGGTTLSSRHAREDAPIRRVVVSRRWVTAACRWPRERAPLPGARTVLGFACGTRGGKGSPFSLRCGTDRMVIARGNTLPLKAKRLRALLRWTGMSPEETALSNRGERRGSSLRREFRRRSRGLSEVRPACS